jgi:hypothetical protein
MKIRMPDGSSVEGTQVSFEPKKEDWNIYECADHTMVKVRVVVVEIYKLDRKDPVTGKNDWFVKFNTVVSTAEK